MLPKGLLDADFGRWSGFALARASGAAFLARCTSGWRGALAAGAAAGAGADGFAAAGGGAVIAAWNAPASKDIFGLGAVVAAGATLTRAGGGAGGAFEA